MKSQTSNFQKKDLQKAIVKRLEKGDAIACYPTSSKSGYTHYFRMVSDKTTVPDKTYWSMKSKGLINETNYLGVLSLVINPSDAPTYNNL